MIGVDGAHSAVRAKLQALPNPDRSFTCTLFWPHESFARLGYAARGPAQADVP
ncbi:hypothetical protein ACIBKY_13975 [Nonomuraea sp. NPDC050394]|uniref:hypothetical protein n=1 Tax=Nonomuraea sp. NPDC050394 TaxID=3364363 RepID=UPI0037943CE7